MTLSAARLALTARTALLVACTLAWPLAHAQKLYESAEQAANSLVEAIRKNDREALKTVLGTNWNRFIPTGDLSREDIATFLAAWDKEHKIVTAPSGASLLSAGSDGWSLPIPIVKRKSGWQFDVVAATDLLRTARIGRNELATMQAVLAYYDAQREYSSADRDDSGVRSYARNLVSTRGKHDGLYWPSAEGEAPSPLGPLLAQRRAKGPGYWGYHYKILTAQGANAAGGAYDYVIGGRMRAGFALVAWPVRYGDTGVMSFMVNHDGVVYEKDLGAGTPGIAQKMTRFDPGPGWKKSQVPQ